MKKIALGIIMAMGSVLFLSNNTFADWIQQSSTYIDSRSYHLGQNQFVQDPNFGNRTIPFNILTNIENSPRELNEFVAYNSVSDNSSDTYKAIQADITVQQIRVDSFFSGINTLAGTGFTVITSKGNAYGGCQVNEKGGNVSSEGTFANYVQWRCSANVPDNATITGIYIRIGDKNGAYPTNVIGRISGSDNNTSIPFSPIQITYLSYNVLSSPDPNMQLLQTQINQNNTIINQNQQIISGIEDINNTITDSTVTGNFNTGPIQPFGPIGTITNAILDLPRIILNITPCQPLTPELPYIHENIEIPCPSVFLNGMAGDFMNFLDVIASAGIWYLVARYIFKKVQKLRDPENTDEEYLDI